MPYAAPHVCGGCGARITGKCPTCTRKRDQRRGSAHARGYGFYWYRRFRPYFLSLLQEQGLMAMCGATLPGGPQSTDSLCKQQGFYTYQSEDSDLHFDHEPPLQAHERHDQQAVCNPLRIQLLCESCHNRKTAKEQRIA